jgi:predicted dehydrogenase
MMMIMTNDFAIIGTGYWGENIARVFHELKSEKKFNHEMYLFDIDSSKSESVAKQYGFKVAKSLEEIIENPKISNVLIITPSSNHYKMTELAIKAKKNVFVEKPFTLNSEEAKELVKLSHENNTLLMVGHIFRYHQGLLELKRRIELGEFGKIMFLIGNKFGYMVPKEDAGVIFTLGVNEFDIFCHLLNTNYPTTITAQRGIFLQKNIEEIANISLTFPNNIQAYFMESWLVPVFGRKRELIVVGSQKTAMIDYLKPNEIVIYDVKIEKDEEDPRNLFKMVQKNTQKAVFEFKEPLKEEMLHYIECIEKKIPCKSDGEIGYRAIKMCELALKSADSGKRLDVIKEIKL